MTQTGSSNSSNKSKFHHHHTSHHHHGHRSRQLSHTDISVIMVKEGYVKDQPLVEQLERLIPREENVKSKSASKEEGSCSQRVALEQQEEREDVPSSTKQLLKEPVPVIKSTETLCEELSVALVDEEWGLVERLCEDYPSLVRESITWVCQGENSKCLPIHVASGHKSVPVSLIDLLVTANPSSLLVKESSGGRLALHLAVLKGASFAVVRYLCEALPQSMSVRDQEGNLPLHYASQYASDAVISLLAKSYPQACFEVNRSDRLPLHLLCARCWDKDNLVRMDTIQQVGKIHPDAVRASDRRGRLPLHVACSSHPRSDLMQWLVEEYRDALLMTDQAKLTPVEIARKFTCVKHDTSLDDSCACSTASNVGGVVLAFLIEATDRERRKKYKLLAPFKKVGSRLAARRKHRADVDALQLHYCYG